MVSLDYIDDFFTGGSIPKKEFEQRILTDNEFAEEVTFYLNTIQVAKATSAESRKDQFKKIYYNNNSQKPRAGIVKLWPYAALMAAAMVLLFIGLYIYQPASEPSKLADTYLSNNLKTLGVQMGNNKELLQQGNSLFNDGDYNASLKKFEEILVTDPSNTDAKENAGKVSLKLNNYKKAITYFSQLADTKGLVENVGKFYLALTYMKRNETGDKEIYIGLLQQVVANDLYGKEEATTFLKQLN